MSIPKVIHYCWFGRNPKPELIQKCIASWKKHCPDWEIIEWNEDNFDVNFCAYTKNAYDKKRWGFLTDVVRLKVIFDHGGVYMDSDVELRRPLDVLLKDNAWFAYGTDTEINTGSGFGACSHHWFVKKLLDNYTSFNKDTPFELCTRIDTVIFKETFPDFAGNHDIEQHLRDVHVIRNIWHYVTHHYTGSWQTPAQRFFSKFRSVFAYPIKALHKKK